MNSNIQTQGANTAKRIKNSSLLWYILSTVIVILIILFIALTLNYLFTTCYEQKPFGQYLADFDFQPCAEKYKPASFKERKLEDEKEVFHIANQDYTYRQAKCKCEAYGGRLAHFNEIADAYNKGAEWCSYGWSHGQNAYYPTQKCTWDRLQRGDKKWRNSCGKPGINGGFFPNPELRFGVNCFGIRPKGAVVKVKKPRCKRKEFCKRHDNRRSAKRLETDEVVPFNKDRWSMYKQ